MPMNNREFVLDCAIHVEDASFLTPDDIEDAITQLDNGELASVVARRIRDWATTYRIEAECENSAAAFDANRE